MCVGGRGDDTVNIRWWKSIPNTRSLLYTIADIGAHRLLHILLWSTYFMYVYAPCVSLHVLWCMFLYSAGLIWGWLITSQWAESNEETEVRELKWMTVSPHSSEHPTGTQCHSPFSSTSAKPIWFFFKISRIATYYVMPLPDACFITELVTSPSELASVTLPSAGGRTAVK